MFDDIDSADAIRNALGAYTRNQFLAMSQRYNVSGGIPSEMDISLGWLNRFGVESYAMRPSSDKDALRLGLIKQRVEKVIALNALLVSIMQERTIHWLTCPLLSIQRGLFSPLACIEYAQMQRNAHIWVLWPDLPDVSYFLGGQAYAGFLKRHVFNRGTILAIVDPPHHIPWRYLSKKIEEKYRIGYAISVIEAPAAPSEVAVIRESLLDLMDRVLRRLNGWHTTSVARRIKMTTAKEASAIADTASYADRRKKIVDWAIQLFPLFLDALDQSDLSHINSLIDGGWLSMEQIRIGENEKEVHVLLPSAWWRAIWAGAHGWSLKVLRVRHKIAMKEALRHPGHTRAIQRALIRVENDLASHCKIYHPGMTGKCVVYSEFMAQGIYRPSSFAPRNVTRIHHKPDGLLSFKINDEDYLMYIEVDGWRYNNVDSRARSTTKIWQEKIGRYLGYYQSFAWRERFYRYPDMLVIACPAERSYGLLRAAANFYPDLPFKIYLMDQADFENAGLLNAPAIDLTFGVCKQAFIEILKRRGTYG